jgi:hypothetical protein
MTLFSCPECSRHIRSSETVCPFCRANVADAPARGAVRTLPAPGISRAAMMAFAAASLGAAACSSSDNTPGGGHQQLRDGATDGAHMTGTGGTANTGGQMFVVFYGAPFPPSGGSPNVGGSANDAGTMIVPLYGGSHVPEAPATQAPAAQAPAPQKKL